MLFAILIRQTLMQLVPMDVRFVLLHVVDTSLEQLKELPDNSVSCFCWVVHQQRTYSRALAWFGRDDGCELDRRHDDATTGK